MKKISLFSTILLAGLLFIGAGISPQSAEARRGDCLAPYKTYNNGKEIVKCIKQHIKLINPSKFNKKDFDIILDVRTQKEHDAGYVKDSKWVPFGILPFYPGSKVTTNKNAKILIYCKSSGRAALAAYFMNRLGYKNAAAFNGPYTKLKELTD